MEKNYKAVRANTENNSQMDSNNDRDSDVVIVGEIPKSYSVSVIKRVSSVSSSSLTPLHIPPTYTFTTKTDLNQFNQTSNTIPTSNPDQNRLLIDLRKKLLLEKLKVAEATRRIKQQESQIISLELENANLTSVIASATVKTLEDEENVSKLLFFLNHFNKEFDCVIEKMNNNEKSDFNSQIENITSKSDIPAACNVEKQLKYMSLDLVTKLEKMVGIHTERKRDLEKTRKKLEEIERQAQYSISLAIASQTWMPSTDAYNYYTNESGTKVPYKRSRCEYSHINYGNYTNWEIVQENVKKRKERRHKGDND